jgi:pimeloyl-ACP methyl ester carboxylesterase
LQQINRKPLNGGDLFLSAIQKQEWGVGLNDLYTRDNQFVCVNLPESVYSRESETSLLIVIHGYGARKNNARGRQLVRGIANFWGQQVSNYNWVVMAPHFDENRFDRNYQRLNLSGLRADLRLNQLIQTLSELISPVEIKARFLLGFSGGGQFGHRYLAFNDQNIARAVIDAPGWFMWPMTWLPYPLGLRVPNEPGQARKRLHRLCSQEMLAFVGDKDIQQGAYRKTYKQVDLCRLQGEGRRERAINWFSTLKKAAYKEKIEFRSHLQLLKNTYHRVNRVFAQSAVNFLTGAQYRSKGL